MRGLNSARRRLGRVAARWQVAGMDPVIIDPRQFARERATVSGSVAAAKLRRVAELLYDTASTSGQQGSMIHYRVTGHVTPKDQAALRLDVNGELELRCQRCLERLPFPLALQREIVLVAGADEFAQSEDEPESVDIIPAVNRIDLRDLVEEEIVLALPLAPRHAAGACELSTTEESPASDSPFAALARLKH